MLEKYGKELPRIWRTHNVAGRLLVLRTGMHARQPTAAFIKFDKTHVISDCLVDTKTAEPI